MCADGELVFSERAGVDVVKSLFLPCGRCAMCRASKAAQLAVRLVHESYGHAQSMAATFTYSPDFLPAAGSVSKRHAQLLLKRVRIEASRRGAPRVRFSLIAEYSPLLARPHYHVILYGYWPPDSVFYNTSKAGNRQFSSQILTDLWGMGIVTFQAFSAGAAGYIARHDSGKLTGDADRFSGPAFDDAGRFVGFREPEFSLCSRRPGLGAEYCDLYGKQMLAHDFTVMDGRKVPVPGAYLRRLEPRFPGEVSDLKAAHELAALKAAPDATRARLAVREVCTRARLSQQGRGGVDHG